MQSNISQNSAFSLYPAILVPSSLTLLSSPSIVFLSEHAKILLELAAVLVDSTLALHIVLLL
jgi:hypothetical protein